MKKRRVLCLLDSPTVGTGFATVARNVLKEIHNTGLYDITVIGINHMGGWYDQEKHPYKIYPAMPQGYTDMYGRGKTFQILKGLDKEIAPPFDLLFTVQDHFILAGVDQVAQGFNFAKMVKELQAAIIENENVPMENLFNWVGYYPVDGALRPYWVQQGIAMTDFPVSYTQFGADQMLKYDNDDIKLKSRLSIIPHGVNSDVFFPISENKRQKFREEFFGGIVKKDTFLIVNVSRNQPRKDMARTIKIYAEYRKTNPKAFLYLHAKPGDVGGDLWEIAHQLGLEEGKHMACPNDKFNEMYGFPIETVNKIYNAADCLLTTTLGEGWGFINTEAMAVKKPILAPANTSIPEIFGMEDIYEKEVGVDYLEANYKTLRGIPLKSGYTNGDWINLGVVDNAVIRPLTSVQDGVEKLDWVFKNPDKVKTIVDNGYEYAQKLTWNKVCKAWAKLFDEAYQDVVKARKKGHKPRPKAVLETEAGNEVPIDEKGDPIIPKDIKRNDPCWCGSKKKYKKCHGTK